MADPSSILNKCIVSWRGHRRVLRVFFCSDTNFPCFFAQPLNQSPSLGDLIFLFSYCQNNENYSNARSHDIQDIYAHWLSGHIDLPNVRALAFIVVDVNAACFYCAKIGTLQQMLKHRKESHRNRSVVIVNPSDQNECGFSSYSDSAWSDHFQLNHKMLFANDTVNPISLADERLSELLAIDIHKKRQCSLCSEIFQMQDQFEEHSAREHSDH